MPNYILARKEKILKSNYTEVGNFAKISNGVASKFSASNYLKTPETFPAPTTSFEAKAKVVTPSAFGECNIIYYCGGSFAMQHEANVSVSAISFWIYKAGTGFERVISVPSTTLLATNSPYWFKVTWDGSVYNLLYSTDDVGYTSLGTYASTTPLLSSGTVAVGLNDDRSVYPYLGSIDLSQSYININGKRWWSGDGYNKVGSWIDDYEASGFSASNYLSFGSIPRPANNPWEIVFKITTGTNVTSWQILFSFQKGATSSTRYGTRIFIMPSGHFAFSVSYNGTAWDVGELTGTEGTYSVQANTDYWLKLEYTGTQYVLYYSLNGIDYIMNSSVTSSTPMYNENQSSYIGTWLGSTGGMLDIFTGSIDLNNSYIKINDELWWTGTKLVPENKYYVFRRKRNRYYKDVVTTKYWKEVTTGSRELEYACYTADGWYVYAKAPLGSDLVGYANNAGVAVLPTNSSQLTGFITWEWVTESSAKSAVGGTATRYTAGDLYKDTTTTTVVEGTADDYTYTTTETTTIEVTSNDEYDRVESGGESTYFPTLKGVN